MRALALFLVLVPALAIADDEDPCANPVTDPVATPVRDVYLDAQRAACMRNEISAGLNTHALVDTPGFHGVLGGDLSLGARFRVQTHYELSAQLRVVDFTFVQNAVNKATHTGVGPLVLGAAAGTSIGTGARGALVAQLELPYTRDHMDTVHVSGQVAGVVTGRLAERFLLHGRLGAVWMSATSYGGDTSRFALRAGADVAWQVSPRMSFQAGAEASAGWYHGFDHVLMRAAAHVRVGARWRLLTGIGAPVGGDERTNAVFDISLAHDR